MEAERASPALELVVEHAVVHTFTLAAGQHVIGRGEGAGIRLLDNAVSTRHATLTVIESPDFPGHFEALLEDAGSKNGTRVNGERMAAGKLEHGDIVSVGHTRLRYVEPGGLEITETGVLLSE